MEQPIFSKRVSAGTRVYYMDVHTDKKGQRYLSISEIPTDKNPGQKNRQRIFCHTSNIEPFAKAFTEAVEFITSEQS